MVASGMRMDAAASSTIRTLSAARQEWQDDAWGYRDMIGELRFGVQFRSRAVARVKFLAAQVMPDEDEPLPLTADKGISVPAPLAKAAQEELERLPLSSGFSFLGVLDENFGITGEAWLHGYEEDGEEKWEVHSVSEVRPGADGRITIRPYGEAAYRVVDTSREEMLRLWVPHPRYKLLADSPMRSLLNVCEEIVLASQELRVVSRSRVATNGLLLVPDTLTLMTQLRDNPDLVSDDRFMADLAAVLTAPIANEGEPGQVAPAVIRGPKDELKEVRHLRLDREASSEIIGRIDKGLQRLARGLDIPPEIVSGLGQANHWSAWQIDNSTYRYHIDPAVRIVADSLTEGFLRPALRARGFSEQDVKKIQVWYDAGNITENPNRGQDAKDAYDRGAIGFDTLRRALGFNESDAPSDEEVLRMAAFKIGVDTNTAGLLLSALFGGDKFLPEKPEPVPVPSQRADQPQEGQDQITAPGQVPPDDGAPPPPTENALALVQALVAAADRGPEWTVDERGGRALLDLERALREQIKAAADAAMERALEKAGARIKSKAQKDRALAASLQGVHALAVGHTLGRDAVLALGVQEHELLADAFGALEEKFTQWTGAAISTVVSVVLRMLRIKPESRRGQRVAARLRDSLETRRGAAWQFLLAGLTRLAERRLFSPEPDEEPGEFVAGSLVPVGLVRGALALLGGPSADSGGVADDGTPANGSSPVGGLALGQEVADTLAAEGAEQLGFEWVYGVTPRNHFHPHQDLDGERFGSWADPRLVPDARYAWVGPTYRPGDHRGCACDALPVWAIPQYSETLTDRLAEDTPSMAEVRRLAEEDDRAGRTGTDAQQTRDQRERITLLRKRFIEQGMA
jgi:hypothetical protein